MIVSDARQRRDEKRTGDVVAFLARHGVTVESRQLSDTIGRRAARRIRQSNAFR